MNVFEILNESPGVPWTFSKAWTYYLCFHEPLHSSLMYDWSSIHFSTDTVSITWRFMNINPDPERIMFSSMYLYTAPVFHEHLHTSCTYHLEFLNICLFSISITLNTCAVCTWTCSSMTVFQILTVSPGVPWPLAQFLQARITWTSKNSVVSPHLIILRGDRTPIKPSLSFFDNSLSMSRRINLGYQNIAALSIILAINSRRALRAPHSCMILCPFPRPSHSPVPSTTM